MPIRSPCLQHLSLCPRRDKLMNYLTDFKALDTNDIQVSTIPLKRHNSKFPTVSNNMAYAPTIYVRVTSALINLGTRKGVL
jgi:hypothetical protein